MNPKPIPGQVWQSTDLRDNGRSLVVTHVNGPWVFVKNVKTGRHSTIAVWRMMHSLGTRGYRLLLEKLPA